MTIQPSTKPEQDRRKVTDHEEYWNGFFEEKPIMIGMMESKVSDKDDEMLITTVGRGICVCLNDKELKTGGLIHILEPQSLKGNQQSLQSEINNLIRPVLETLTSKGAEPENIKAKLFGCGHLSPSDKEEEARLLYGLVRECLSRNQINVSMEDMGQAVGRRIHFFPKNGKAVRRLLQRQVDRDVLIERENTFNQNYTY
jgi:chemotaxis protein CheD